MSVGFAKSRLLRRSVPLVTAMIAVLGLSAACSSSGGTATTSAGGGAAKFSGAPIKLGMITDVGTAVDFSDEIVTAKASVRALNAKGGINGHEVTFELCNEALNPNTAVTCARKMVSDHVMAMVGDYVVTADAEVATIFRNAGIANVAANTLGPLQTDPNSYLLDGGQTYYNAAQAVALQKVGAKRVGLLLLDAPTTLPYKAFYQKAFGQLGMKLVNTTLVPQVTTDLSPQAANLMSSSPDALNTNASEPADYSVFKEMAQLGFKGDFAVSGDLLTEAEINQLGSLANQLVFASPFPPVGAATQFPGLVEFKKDMAAEKAAGVAVPTFNEFNKSLALGSYLGVVAIGEIANQYHATDAASFKKAINEAKDVPMRGLMPPWTPNKSLTPKDPRASNGSYFFYRDVNGKAVLLNSKPTDVTDTVNAGSS
jgi:branched-chain amino acid transport system substrate-binding protein